MIVISNITRLARLFCFPILNTQWRYKYPLWLCGFFLLLCCIASLFIGNKPIPIPTIWQSLFTDIQSPDTIIILQSRLPRTLAGILAGLALGGAGALMQAMTRNPLADPGILGINAGASLALVIAISFLDVHNFTCQTVIACIGAGIAGLLVWLISASWRSSNSPSRLILSGVAISALFSGLTMNITLIMPEVFDQFRYWHAGSLNIGNLHAIKQLAPVIITGCFILLFLARSLNSLYLGDDIAVSHGINIRLIRLLSILAIILCCGGATALTGPISFVGLMVPAIARHWYGTDQQAIILSSLLIAPSLVLTADIIGRLLTVGELAVSIMTALIGAPVLILLVLQPTNAREQ